MKIKNLFSSSSGNATVVETDTTVIVIDAGVSYTKLKNAYGKDLSVDAIFITHEHGDHVQGAGILGRKTGSPVYMPQASFEKRANLFNNCKIEYITGGNKIKIGNLEILAYSTKHDSAASVGYIVTELDTGKKFGLLTDTGAITPLIHNVIKDCNGLFLESDYDETKLAEYDGYDDFLKDRIRSRWGHLSNQETLTYLQKLDLKKVEWIILGHLSKNTNSPETLERQIKITIPKNYWNKIHIATQPLTLNL